MGACCENTKLEFEASRGGMKTVAESTALNDAIAQMSDRAWELLRDVHAERRSDGRDAAAALMRDLAKLTQGTGVEPEGLPSYDDNATHWRAIARLAGASITSARTPQAG